MHQKLCPCCSGKPYSQCCQPFHKGVLPLNALALMRSRYSAYANQLPEYIIATTHPQHPQYHQNQSLWEKQILQFCQQTEFQKLEILEFVDGQNEAWVTFTAHLQQNKKDGTFIEKSHFVKLGKRWLYRDGEMKR